MVNRFDVFLVNLDEDLSKNAKNTRPAVVISPEEMNKNLETVIVAPLASTNAHYPTRIEIDFLNSSRFIILDQIRTVDQSRLVKKIGAIEGDARKRTIDCLQELFAV